MASPKLASPGANRLWIAALVFLASVYLFRLGPLQYEPAFGDAPSIYLVSAQSLAHGTGYRSINYPDAPPSQLYPVGYPFALSLILRAAPFGLKSIFIARLLTVISTLIWIEATRRLLLHAVSPCLAAYGALTTGLTTPALELSGQIKADLVFGAILMVTVVLAMTDSRTDSNRRFFLRGAALGILGACAMLVRTIGFTIVFGLVLDMLLRKRWRQLFGFAVAGAVALGPWVLWSFFHNGGTFHSYVAENAISWRIPFSHFWALATGSAPTMAFVPFDTPAWKNIAARLHLEWAPILLGLAITALVILGWISLLRRRHVVALILGPYMAIVFFWWFEATRFVVPVLPLIVFCAAVGAKIFFAGLSIPARRNALSAVAFCIISGAVVDINRLRHLWKDGNLYGTMFARQWTDMEQGLTWIKGNTPPDAAIFSSYPAGVWLFSSRPTLDLNDASHVGKVYTPPDSIDLGAAIERNQSFRSLYVYICQRDDNTPARRYIDGHPAQFDLQWASDDGIVRLYKVIFSS